LISAFQLCRRVRDPATADGGDALDAIKRLGQFFVWN
jgi:hypothetical protein